MMCVSNNRMPFKNAKKIQSASLDFCCLLEAFYKNSLIILSVTTLFLPDNPHYRQYCHSSRALSEFKIPSFDKVTA